MPVPPSGSSELALYNTGGSPGEYIPVTPLDKGLSKKHSLHIVCAHGAGMEVVERNCYSFKSLS
jgi:hypothetical protein